ncbi:MAG: DNA alkylation repair protein [Oscillospiraceae bacterium]
MTPIQSELFALQDKKYRDFHAGLLPTVPKETIIGIRKPAIRGYAKKLAGTPEAASFMRTLPHEYFDENDLHGMLINEIKDYLDAVAALDAFLPYVDNWATCDLIRPLPFKKHPADLIENIRRWMDSEHTYTCRFGMEMLMTHYLDAEFETEYLDWVADIRSEEYYLRMMQAWFFATALAKQYDAALPYIENRRLDKWTHNKAIQKSIESYRVSYEHKAYLRGLRI